MRLPLPSPSLPYSCFTCTVQRFFVFLFMEVLSRNTSPVKRTCLFRSCGKYLKICRNFSSYTSAESFISRFNCWRLILPIFIVLKNFEMPNRNTWLEHEFRLCISGLIEGQKNRADDIDHENIQDCQLFLRKPFEDLIVYIPCQWSFMSQLSTKTSQSVWTV